MYKYGDIFSHGWQSRFMNTNVCIFLNVQKVTDVMAEGYGSNNIGNAVQLGSAAAHEAAGVAKVQLHVIGGSVGGVDKLGCVAAQ